MTPHARVALVSLLWIAAAVPAHAYVVGSSALDATTVQYHVACSSGESSFDAFDLQVDPSESVSNFQLLSGPPGWSIAGALVSRDGGVYVRVTGPPLSCPGDYDLVVRYLGSHGKTGYAHADVVANETVVHASHCILGWFDTIICEPPFPNFTCPSYVLVVGKIHGGSDPDPAGLATITVRDFANDPVVGAVVTLDFSGVCDIDLCNAVVNGQTVSCAARHVQGVTNASGQFTFTVLGAARDPGPCDGLPGCTYPGAGQQGVKVYVSSGAGNVLACSMTAVALDQNGATGSPSANGVSIGDVAVVLNLFGSVGLGGPYRGRGDINRDGNITISDVGAELGHLGRLALANGVGCTASFCGGPGCP